MSKRNRIELSKLIAAVRADLGISQVEFAKRVGISQSAISKIENGIATLDALVLIRIARMSERVRPGFMKLLGA